MRKTGIALFGLAVLATAPLAALAQPGPGGGPGGGPGAGPGPRGARGPGALFEQVDANRDGRVTWDETWSFVQGRFSAADRDGNGGLSQEEVQEAMRSHWAGRRAAAGQATDGTAGPGPGPGPGPRRDAPDFARHAGMMFRALDANRDGRVTLDEARPAIEARFRALDANLDNVVERSELPQPRSRGPGRGGPGNAPNNAPGGAAPANPG